MAPLVPQTCSGICRLSSRFCQSSTHQGHFWFGCCFWKWWGIRIRKKKMLWSSFVLFYSYSLAYNLYIFPSFIDILSRFEWLQISCAKFHFYKTWFFCMIVKLWLSYIQFIIDSLHVQKSMLFLFLLNSCSGYVCSCF